MNKIIALGADVNMKNNVGKTALHAAMGQNRSTITDILVTAGASLNDKDSRGMTPLHECAYKLVIRNVYTVFALKYLHVQLCAVNIKMKFLIASYYAGILLCSISNNISQG